jgi:hypothetical protein
MISLQDVQTCWQARLLPASSFVVAAIMSTSEAYYSYAIVTAVQVGDAAA